MTIRNDAVGARGVMPPATASRTGAMVRVWDPFVRIFHWSLAALFVLAFATGDESEWLHLTAGYSIAGLLLLRAVWGFVGPAHARFGDFVRSPQAVLAYLRQTIRMRAPRYLGHNPAGGVMVLALMATLAAISVTGFMMTTDAFWGSEWVENLHKAFVYAALVLVALHVAGVLFASIEHGENLVKAMVTGRKRAP